MGQGESVCPSKVTNAVASENWDALMEILSTVNSQAWDEGNYYGLHVLYKAIRNKRCDVIEFLVQEGWPIPLDHLLRHTIRCSNRLGVETVERLCWLGAGGITNVSSRVKHQVAIHRILLEHNVISPRMLFCEEGDLVENETPQQQQSLVLILGILGDRCWKRDTRFRGTWFVAGMKNEDVLGLTELYARNGAPIAVRPSLQERLPEACGPRVSALLAAALQPASLHSLCRKALRRAGPKRHFKSWVVTKLGLPRRLSDYVCSSEA